MDLVDIKNKMEIYIQVNFSMVIIMVEEYTYPKTMDFSSGQKEYGNLEI